MKKTTNQKRVALGSFPLAGVFNPVTKEGATDVINTFLDQGGYYIDTAPMYGFGYVERLLGEVLRLKARDSYYLITKCGKHIDEVKKIWTPQATYADVIAQCEESLTRLNTDYIDLYLIHEPDKTTPFEETMRALIDLRTQGKIREIGISNVTLQQLKEYRKFADVRYIQNKFSFINRSIEPEYSKYLATHLIQLIPYHILEIAQLTGSVLEDGNLGNNDFRNTLPYFNSNKLSVIRTWVKKHIQPIAKNQGCTIGQLIIAWTLRQAHIPYVLVGTTKPQYVSINMKAQSINLTHDTYTALETAYNQLVTYIHSTYQMSIREFRGLNACYF